MEPIVKLIASLGGLHDSILLDLFWHPNERRFEFWVDDMYSNSEGFPDYPGPAKGRFVFTQVEKLNIEVDFREVGLMIYDWTFAPEKTEGFACEILFSPGGRISIECKNIERIKGE